MLDTITKIGDSIIHHGKSNNRIYLMSLAAADLPVIVGELDTLARANGYTKIIAKVPTYAKELFEASGYLEEATIPNFYNGKVDGHFLGKYLEANVKIDQFKNHCVQVLEWAKSKEVTPQIKPLKAGFSCRRVVESDVEEMALLYQEIFKSYPFPIDDVNYLLKTMSENVIYYGIWHKQQLVALSSIEAAKEYSNAEMTDFATLKAYRGNSFASYLLAEMEKAVEELGFHTTYTIARAKSYGMNITFAKQGYTYAGQLVNNTNIAGSIESMNVWYKTLKYM